MDDLQPFLSAFCIHPLGCQRDIGFGNFNRFQSPFFPVVNRPILIDVPVTMDAYYVWLAVVLLVTMIAGLARVLRGPKPADRMLGMQLCGTTGVAVLLLLAKAMDADALQNVALVLLLLALLVLIAFVERTPPAAAPEKAGDS
jgi:multicomponent Na+:H+ antiporter subunit F